jgi:hypothetical protein
MRNAQCRIWNIGRKIKNVDDETQTLYDLEYSEKPEKCEKREMHTVGPGLWREN